MALRQIVTLGSPAEPVLHKTGERVRVFDEELHQLLDDMVETMRDAPGVGLAAPQIGLSRRIAVVEYPLDEDNPEETLTMFELINPEIIKAKGADVAQEGCLSLPNILADVERATHVVVRAQDRNGKEVRIKAYDWLARIFQHEIDHLHGILMTERAEVIYQMRENEEGEVIAVPLGAPAGEEPSV
jgi:peptide deformylase